MMPGAIARVMRLMQSGQLAKATAAIQGSLQGGSQDLAGITQDEASNDAVIEGQCQRIDAGAATAEPARKSSSAPGSATGNGAEVAGKDNARGRFLSLSFNNAAGTRTYKLYVPSGYCGDESPLVVMLHGCTQSPDDFAAGTRMNVFAEKHGWLVAYPAQPPSANGSKCWNWFKPEEQQRERGEPSLIAGITRHVVQNYAVDAGRVYVAGLSSGAAMAAIMAATYPELYAAVGVHSGLAYGAACDLPTALAAMRSGSAGIAPSTATLAEATPAVAVPAIVFHGDRDTTVHPRNGEAIVAQWSAAHAAAGSSTSASDWQTTEEDGQAPHGHAYTRRVIRDRGGHAVVEHWRLHGAGHAWSGGSARGSYTDPKGPDATREMLRFFGENQKGARTQPAVGASTDY